MLCVVLALLVTVTVSGLLVLPTFVAGKTRLAGETAIVTCPVPDSCIRCGAPLIPLSTMVMAPGIDPITVGENVTLTVQVAFAARGLLLTQLSLSP